MTKKIIAFGMIFVASTLLATVNTSWAHGDETHQVEPADDADMLQQMQDMHRGHQHEHDFEAMDKMSPEDMREVMRLMTEVGLALPPMDPHRGRELFLGKGCIVCHSVNGVGGDVGPSLDAAEMPEPMNAFEFAARMWRGAPAMVAMQQSQFGEIIDLNGQELADIIGFVHDENEQKELTADQIPDQFKDQILR